MKYIISLIIAALAAVSITTPALATRPVPGHLSGDVCPNIKGVQYTWQTVGTGIYRIRHNGNCYVWNVKH